mgnify:CR=1 FL=1
MSSRHHPKLVEEARKVPGGWVYEIVGEYKDSDAVPPSAIRGAWHVDDSGRIDGDFLPNPSFIDESAEQGGHSSRLE